MSETVDYKQQGPVATITLNRPDSLNGFNAELRADMLVAFEKANDDASVRVVILAGSGRGFSSGADLNERLNDERSIEEKLQKEYRPVFDIIARMPKPVIAAVNGFAAGIGMSYALHADLVIMADDAFMLLPFTTISLLPDGGANWMLVNQIGYHRAFQLSIESDRISAQQCLEMGLVNRLAPAEELADAAMAWANKISERAPLSIAATKKVMRRALDENWEDCYDMEAGLQDQLSASEDSAEGVAAFLDKRTPKFTGK